MDGAGAGVLARWGMGAVSLSCTLPYDFHMKYLFFFIVFEANIVCCAVFTSFFSAAATAAAVNKPNKPKEI